MRKLLCSKGFDSFVFCSRRTGTMFQREPSFTVWRCDLFKRIVWCWEAVVVQKFNHNTYNTHCIIIQKNLKKWRYVWQMVHNNCFFVIENWSDTCYMCDCLHNSVSDDSNLNLWCFRVWSCFIALCSLWTPQWQ